MSGKFSGKFHSGKSPYMTYLATRSTQGAHQVTQSRCSGSLCDRSGSSSACSWSGSTPRKEKPGILKIYTVLHWYSLFSFSSVWIVRMDEGHIWSTLSLIVWSQTCSKNLFSRVPWPQLQLSAHLDNLVPATRHNDWILSVGGESHAWNPVIMAVLLWREKIHLCIYITNPDNHSSV